MCWCENVEMLLLAGMLDNKEIHILTFPHTCCITALRSGM